MIWIVLGAMLFAASLVVAWPLYRLQRRVTPSLVGAVATVLIVSAVVYSQIGTPVAPREPATIDEMVASLALRLEQDADDLDGWAMLGRSYMQLQRYAEAVTAYERAVELESASNAQTLADLGEAIVLSESGSVSERAALLFENAVGLEANNPKALFYGGIAAIERNDRALAADRWEALLALAPPPEIQEVLRQRVAEWRGVEQPAAAAQPESASDSLISANVSLGTDAAQQVGPNVTVFIIARDPDQPSPPVAAVRRRASELPATVTLGDADAMIPGRLPSNFERLEIIARASLSGEPVQQSGDWYGAQIVTVADSSTVDIVIEHKVQ
jgi:cytochrome c-type biogenesis protein CcmH